MADIANEDKARAEGGTTEKAVQNFKDTGAGAELLEMTADDVANYTDGVTEDEIEYRPTREIRND